ncbi:universal stress protein [Mucilaginibacter gotjawali]|uniref:Universal stress protein family protein n=2 Tax=Mucilaginibacter gotjawali TaxID=1550579 RepID=A0A0X8X107_9SPHI|nr:universal stress protein [Mucilaginibacter gotjawali]MBB3058786.1 nucleotide-binding universal stress UspA family protein [Mucilaginibacter gotjawali]BAU53835.1 Universal stress protein family protein [Mucilaginibacter gotjawali]
MKSILVLTDFSDNSENAAELGVKLCAKLNTNLLLFNTYVTNSAEAYVAEPWVAEDIFWGDDDSKDNLNKLATALKTDVEKLGSEDHKPVIYCDNGEGKLGIIIPGIIQKHHVEMILMGARAFNPDDDGLFGSDLNSTIQKSSRPVLVVPSKINLEELKKVVFATDFDESDMLAIHYLAKLSKLLNFELEIIHIIHPDKSGKEKSQKEIELEEQVSRLKYPSVTYHDIKGNDVAENILRIYKESGAGLLAMIHHQHSFIMRMLHQSTTKKLLDNQEVPLMIFPSKMK